MKTEKEIEIWLKKRKWCSSFMLQTLATHEHRTAVEIFNGSLLRRTIASAFDWERSIEGVNYWASRHCEFVKWFENENRRTN